MYGNRLLRPSLVAVSKKIEQKDQVIKEKSEKIHLRRTVVLNKFIDLYGHKLKIQDNKRINDYLKAEDFRYSGDWLKIIFSNIRFVDKLRFIFESNSTLYYIKNNFSWIFLGRG